MMQFSLVEWELLGLGTAWDNPSDWGYYIDAETAGSTTAVNLGTAAGQPNVTMPSYIASTPDYWNFTNIKRGALSLAYSQIGAGDCTWAALLRPTTLNTSSRRFWSTGAGFGTGADPGWGLFCRQDSATSIRAGLIVEQSVASGGIFRFSIEVGAPSVNKDVCIIGRQYNSGVNIDIWCNGVRSNKSSLVPAGTRNAANASEIGGLHGFTTVNLNHRLYRLAMDKSFMSDEDVIATTFSWLSDLGVEL